MFNKTLGDFGESKNPARTKEKMSITKTPIMNESGCYDEQMSVLW
jgi:hypothetical protein